MSASDQNDNTSGARRKLLRTIAAGGSALSVASLPGKWTRPMVASVILPAHAQTSPGECVGTLDNCPPGYSFSTILSSGAYTYGVDPGSVDANYPGISVEGGTLTGQFSTSDSYNIGPCPSPCGDVDGQKYYAFSASFGDGYSSYGYTFGVRCGGEPVYRLSGNGTGTYVSSDGTLRTYTGTYVVQLDGCKYLSPSEPMMERQPRRRRRRFRFGG